ncbi:MAG: hypothetical protein PHE15_00745 [Dehalococcoidales bacterium]|nr:hypothetical protein [Dehalococcoidales bacterium]
MKKIFILTLLSFCLLAPSSLPVAAQDNGYTTLTESFTINSGEKGQEIPTGAIIQHFDNGETKVYASNNSLILKTSDSYADSITTPDGLMKANHVYGVPSGTFVDHVGNILKFYDGDQLILTVIDKESDNKESKSIGTSLIIPSTGGWVECAKDTGRKPDTFAANWVCPSSPPGLQSNIVNFLFTAIETWTGGSIIQPVLQWNQGGAPGWSGASWYVYNGGSVHTDATPVSVGNNIYGYMHSQGTTTWYISIQNLNTGGYKSLTVNTNIPVNPLIGNQVFVALESYNTSNGYIYDTDMPGDTTFSNIAITLNGQQLNVQWYKKMYSDPYFQMTGLDVTWSGNSSVTLHTAN